MSVAATKPLIEALKSLGFVAVRGAGSALRLPLDDMCTGWVGLDLVKRGMPRGWIRVFVLIGVRVEPVMQRMDQLYEGMADKNGFQRVPLHRMALHNIADMDHRPEWVLTGGEDLQSDEATIAAIIELMTSRGLPWIRSQADIEGLIELQARYAPVNQMAGLYWAVLLEVMGRHDEAKRAREFVWAKYEGATYGAADDIRTFLRRMEEMPYEAAEST